MRTTPRDVRTYERTKGFAIVIPVVMGLAMAPLITKVWWGGYVMASMILGWTQLTGL